MHWNSKAAWYNYNSVEINKQMDDKTTLLVLYFSKRVKVDFILSVLGRQSQTSGKPCTWLENEVQILFIEDCSLFLLLFTSTRVITWTVLATLVNYSDNFFFFKKKRPFGEILLSTCRFNITCFHFWKQPYLLELQDLEEEVFRSWKSHKWCDHK